MLLIMKSCGFTVVELVIVIAIIGTLLTLSIVGIQSSQRGARDNERRVDVENIALSLENGRTQNAHFAASGPSYPSILDMNRYLTGATTPGYSALPDIDPASLRAPNRNSEAKTSVVLATNGNTTIAGVRPQPTFDTYVYQPMRSATALCENVVCRSYNLYYRLEGDNQVHVVRSRHQ